MSLGGITLFLTDKLIILTLPLCPDDARPVDALFNYILDSKTWITEGLRVTASMDVFKRRPKNYLFSRALNNSLLFPLLSCRVCERG